MFINERDINQKISEIKYEDTMAYLKLVMVGSKTRTEHANDLENLIKAIDGWFVTGEGKVMREALHKLVDLACDAQEKSNG